MYSNNLQFSCPTVVKHDPSLPTEYRTVVIGSQDITFQKWVKQERKETVIRFWRDVIEHLESSMKLESFRICVRNGWDKNARKTLNNWDLEVLYQAKLSNTSASHDQPATVGIGPVIAEKCMSCNLETPLAQGVMGDEESQSLPSSALKLVSQDSLIFEDSTCRVWLDAKGRPMFVVTPVKHVERINQLQDDEIHQLMITFVTWLDKLSLANGFAGLVINHGENRTHEHLHLKVKVNYRVWRDGIKRDSRVWNKFTVIEDWAGDFLPQHRKGDRNAWMKRMEISRQQPIDHLNSSNTKRQKTEPAVQTQ
eukprot:TRINITY_DN26864_c0_g1_i1.p1 TRINITY_DN26864_c0_g1~~TRINITY_DN26864_c0_g1_i1.p1  ORF type:complete len:309 (-),score=70.30 TRINITY_DN26864_c0_g1_i1:59-985(-)